MQLCKQETLKDWLVKRSPVIDYSRSLEIFLQIRDAVEYFHKQGMMHRDLKVILLYSMHTQCNFFSHFMDNIFFILFINDHHFVDFLFSYLALKVKPHRCEFFTTV